MIISSFTCFGLKLYERKRISEETLTLNFDKIHCEDIGLYLVGEYPRMKYNYVSIYKKHEWDKLAYETFSLAILSLVSNKIIEIIQFNDAKSYLFNSIKFNLKGYYFKFNKVSNNRTNDLFSNNIIKSIVTSHSEDKNKSDIYKVIHLVLNIYLGKNGEYNRPAKQFLVKNLNQYAKNFDWIKINEQKKLLGIYKDYQINIKEIYIPRIKMQHNAIKDKHKELRNSNLRYWHFSDTLRKCLEKDFTRREPSDDTGVD